MVTFLRPPHLMWLHKFCNLLNSRRLTKFPHVYELERHRIALSEHWMSLRVYWLSCNVQCSMLFNGIVSTWLIRVISPYYYFWNVMSQNLGSLAPLSQNVTLCRPPYRVTWFIDAPYDVKAYVLLIAIRQSDGDVKPGRLLCALDNNRLMPAPGFPFTLTHLIFITHKLYNNTTHIYTHPKYLPISTVTHDPVMWSAAVVHKLKMGHNPASIHCIAGTKCLTARIGIRNICLHINKYRFYGF